MPEVAKRLYDNCIIQAPDGEMLSRCNTKKANWYIDKGLAVAVANDPLTIRLKFEPSGRNDSDPFTIEAKQNICVVCGDVEDLTVHHVIPYCFIRCMPKGSAAHNIHDCLALCRPCHVAYEERANEKKLELSKRYDIPTTGEHGGERYVRTSKIIGMSIALVGKTKRPIPEERQKEIRQELIAILGYEPTHEELVTYANTNFKTFKNDYKTFGEMLIERLESLDEFAREWRQHFVDTMKPKYLPNHWKVDRHFGAWNALIKKSV